uniref:Uncharacterized protein n=1 Tax=Mus spicilegus TaxID=10103 RepID=A0A8C6H1L3_MUSSI
MCWQRSVCMRAGLTDLEEHAGFRVPCEQPHQVNQDCVRWILTTSLWIGTAQEAVQLDTELGKHTPIEGACFANIPDCCSLYNPLNDEQLHGLVLGHTPVNITAQG